MPKKNICVIGVGKWGKNHTKTLDKLGCLTAIVDDNKETLSQQKSLYPYIETFDNVDDAILRRYDGYVVATPAETHFNIAEKIICAGLNVLVEKPMTLSTDDSRKLVEEANRHNARLMVGHLLLFHPAIIKIKETIDAGRIGKLYYLYSNRLNLGTVRTEESVFSSFAPHDISVLNYIIGSKAVKIDAKGVKFLQDKVYDTTMTMLEYPDNVHAHIFVSWLHPFKEQRLVIVGSEGMISFDDSTKEKEIHLYNKHIDFEAGVPVKIEKPDEIVAYIPKMPLEEELQYFVSHLDSEIAISTGRDGHEVVKVLEQVEDIIAGN